MAVSGLVFNFLPDPEAAVASIRERVRRGGRIAADLGITRQGWSFSVCSGTRRSPWTRARLPSTRRFPLCEAPALGSLFRAGGLTGVETGALEIPTDFTTFDDYWLPFLRGTGPAPAFVASLDPAHREPLRERLARRLRRRGDGRISLRARAWAVRGVSLAPTRLAANRVPCRHS